MLKLLFKTQHTVHIFVISCLRVVFTIAMVQTSETLKIKPIVWLQTQKMSG